MQGSYKAMARYKATMVAIKRIMSAQYIYRQDSNKTEQRGPPRMQAVRSLPTYTVTFSIFTAKPKIKKK